MEGGINRPLGNGMTCSRSNSRASILGQLDTSGGNPSRMSLRLSSAPPALDAKRARVSPSSRSEKISIRSGSTMEEER